MSTSNHASSNQMTRTFRIHFSERHVLQEDLEIDTPLYLVISQLAQRHQLPVVEGGYGFFAGAERRPLSREVPLTRTPYANGGELYLAPVHTPWWAPIPTVAAMPTPAVPVKRTPTLSLPARPRLSLTPQNILLITIGVIAIAMLGLLFWPQGTTNGTGSNQSVSIVAPSEVIALPTATLLPATPTPDAATQARQHYQDGMTAYAAENWSVAAEHFQEVYAYDASYREIASVLSASFYNWGITTRDEGDITTALAHFQSTIKVDSNHTLARTEIQKANIYLDAQKKVANGNLDGAIQRYQSLIEMNGGNYADATTQIYELLLNQAETVAQQGGDENLQRALELYRAAAGVEVIDRSKAEQGVVEIQALLPTPTPIPRPTATPQPRPAARLRFSVANYNDDPGCISIKINGISPAGWYFSVDGIRGVSGRFDGGGNARACGLAPGQEVTISVIDGNGRVVPGGSGVPSKGSAIMIANWN